MVLQALLLTAGVAFAEAPAKPVQASPERTLAGLLSTLRGRRAGEMRRSVMGGAEELRDAVTSGSGAARKQLAGRLPGMAEDPFNVCRDLARCKEAPVSLHVEEDFLADDAFLALARPWIKLQEARGKAVKVSMDPGVGVQLELEDLPRWPVVTLAASPTPTGGFDVTVDDGPEAAKAYAVERAAVLSAKK